MLTELMVPSSRSGRDGTGRFFAKRIDKRPVVGQNVSIHILVRLPIFGAGFSRLRSPVAGDKGSGRKVSGKQGRRSGPRFPFALNGRPARKHACPHAHSFVLSSV